MSFADPQSVTVSGTAISLPRTASGASSGAFSSADGLTQLTVSSAVGRRTRRTIRLSQTKVAADTFIPTQNTKYSQTVYIVCDAPLSGFTVTDQKALVDALTAYLTASTGARVTQLLGGEN